MVQDMLLTRRKIANEIGLLRHKSNMVLGTILLSKVHQPSQSDNTIIAILHFSISDFFKFFYHKKVETLKFSIMYDTYRCPSSMWMLSFREGMEKSKNGQC